MVVRLGYSSLHWAALSTEISICRKAYYIYRSILEPINEPCLYVLLKSLLGVLVDWDKSAFTSENEESDTVLEINFIITTILSATRRLAASGNLQHHPSMFWTALALLRSPDHFIYEAGLQMVLCMRAYPYLFKGRPRAVSASPPRIATIATIAEESGSEKSNEASISSESSPSDHPTLAQTDVESKEARVQSDVAAVENAPLLRSAGDLKTMDNAESLSRVTGSLSESASVDSRPSSRKLSSSQEKGYLLFSFLSVDIVTCFFV
jgi:hypothetical protein